MHKKPIIGIIGKVEPRPAGDLWNRIAVVDELRYLVVKNGGTSILLLPTENTMEFNDNDIKDDRVLNEEELEDLYRQLEFCDGFILQGGLYSCNYEIEIAKKVLEINKPLIGICAGFNNILRALGTGVLVDVSKKHDHYDDSYRHRITIIKDTRLYYLIGKESLDVNSIHTMIATRELVEPFATISSYSEDGLVESYELDNKRFVMGIKWHPELLQEEAYVDKLFKEFIDSCKN